MKRKEPEKCIFIFFVVLVDVFVFLLTRKLCRSLFEQNLSVKPPVNVFPILRRSGVDAAGFFIYIYISTSILIVFIERVP
jgi:hypothetical protein